MTDYRTMFDSEHLYAFHLQGREVTLQIDRVKAGAMNCPKAAICRAMSKPPWNC